VYRDLSKPMGALGAERAQLFASRYANWEDPSGVVPPFNYGTHYSSAATVLYYLIRLEPFTRSNLHLQGGKFDHADRLFTNLATAWTSASSQGGLSDVKELIPEFFTLPSFLKNSNRFDLGEHQRGGYVGDVVLPPWAHGDARIFVRLHRKALESPTVSAHLHEWIDLIFGHKQRGPAAVKAMNVFYYLTYSDTVDVNAISDPMEKQAVISQISNFGQTPHQIFKKPHPQRATLTAAQRLTIASHPHLLHPLPAGSGGALPQLPSRRVSCLYWSTKQEKLFALDGCKVVVPGSLSKYVSWGHADQSLRFAILQTSARHRTLDEVVAVHEALHDGQISAVSVTDDGQGIVTGGEDGMVKVWRLHPEHKHKQLMLSRTLPAHAAHVTALAHALSYSLLVTAAADGSVSFYDLHSLSLQHRLPAHPFAVRCVCVDPYRGDVVTAAGPHLYVWDVNGDLVAQHLGSGASGDTIESVVWTSGPEGAWIEPNVVTGHRDGSIRIWRLVYPTASVAAPPELTLPSPAASSAAAATTASQARRRSANISLSQVSGLNSEAAPARVRTGSMVDLSFSSSSTLTPVSPASAGGSPVPLASFPIAASSVAAAPAAGSLGQGFLGLELCHRLESVHDAPVSALHVSVTDWKRLWSGDRSGRVVAWQLSSDEHWAKDAERQSCTGCQTRFTVLERRHHCRECGLLFCSRCSSHRLPLEHLGFSQSVRVCDACYDKLSSAQTTQGAASPSAAAAAASAASAAHARAPSSNL